MFVARSKEARCLPSPERPVLEKWGLRYLPPGGREPGPDASQVPGQVFECGYGFIDRPARKEYTVIDHHWLAAPETHFWQIDAGIRRERPAVVHSQCTDADQMEDAAERGVVVHSAGAIVER